MAKHHTCPVWMGYVLLNPLRRFYENPRKMFKPFIREGMVVLEPGCGMGFFTLPLARMVGPDGKVVAVDLQPGMLSRVEKRARKAGLEKRIVCHQAREDTMAVESFSGQVDLAAAIHVAHEIPDQARFFEEVHGALKPGGSLLVIEPKFHVAEDAFEKTVSLAKEQGFDVLDETAGVGGRNQLFKKSL